MRIAAKLIEGQHVRIRKLSERGLDPKSARRDLETLQETLAILLSEAEQLASEIGRLEAETKNDHLLSRLRGATT